MTDAPLGEDLRAWFRESAQSRIEEMRALLAREELDAAAIHTLTRHFHAFAGLGGTYGFPRITDHGDEAEGLILPVDRGREPLTPELVARWRELTEEISRELEASGGPAWMPPHVDAAPAPEFNVLVVEDDPVTAELLVRAMASDGMSARACATRDCALSEIASRTPDAAVIDVLLPDGSGYEVLEALRRAAPSAGAIVISARDTFIDKVRALRGGADAFIGKPLDLPALVRRVAAFRDRKDQPPCRVLAVEDEPTQTLLTRRILGSAGYSVEICNDPAQFEELLESFCPDLLLMDIQLRHDVSGYDLVRYIRRSERFANVPVIFVTGETARKAAIDGAHSGGDLFVVKPVDWELLLTQIDALLRRAEAVRAVTERDALTGLLTRGAFEMRVRQRDGRPAALALIDVDRFKEVNDAHGHAAGDQVLVSLGIVLRRGLRAGDFAARYGGEEFAVLLDDLDAGGAAAIVERLLHDFRSVEHGRAGSVTFSAGVTSLDASFEASFRRADAALYEAKRAGRARVVVA